MGDVQEQLAWLRQKMAQIDAKYGAPTPIPPPKLPLHREFVEEVMSGSVIETPRGKHFETEKLYPLHKRHGSFDISDLLQLPEDLLTALSDGSIPACHPRRWAFLDTETTGLAGGSGTYAFLIGIGSVDEEGFRVRQFFMREYSEEASQLHAVAQYLDRFDVMITYNGKTYDQPLLETRFRMSRMKPPFGRLEHLDLLFGSRRLWKLRLENCRLSYLENQILGLEREGDVPGELIPHYFFEYVRTQRAVRLIPIFHHNVMDIVSLACLTAIVPEAFRSPAELTVRHGADLIGIARWLREAGQTEECLAMLRRAVDAGLPDALLFRTLFDIAVLEKKAGREDVALSAFSELAASPNPYRGRAYEELAKYYEHRERNYAMALEMARAQDDSPERQRREQRLQLRLQRTARVRACGKLELSQ
jgi:uncharacterized protein YprB with RNaseH-like and TPR domain